MLRRAGLGLYIAFLMVPLYWMVVMSFKTKKEIETGITLLPQEATLANYTRVFTSEAAPYQALIDQSIYVGINAVLSVLLALPAAYAFSRYRFLGDKHLFFWLLSNRMAPAAVFAIPFLHLYSGIGLKDTYWAVALAHMLFNVPLAVWILEGFISGIPKQIDETAYLEGASFPGFFIKIMTPLIAPGIGVALFFCFMYSWIEVILVERLTSKEIMPLSRALGTAIDPASVDYGLLAALGTLSIIPGLLVLWFVRKHIARGFAMGRV